MLWKGEGFPAGLSMGQEDFLIEGILDVDYALVVKVCEKICELWEKTEICHVTSPLGTDISFQLKGRPAQLERHTGSGAARIAVGIEFILLRSKGNDLLLQKNYSEERTVAGDDMGASITAYQEAIGTIFQQLLADLPRL